MTGGACGVYKRRDCKNTSLYQILDRYFSEFKGVYEKRFQEEYGFWRNCVDKAVYSFLACGLFEYGFAKAHCKECGYDMLVPFSCKGRCFCPSCQKKRAIWWAEWLSEEVLSPVNHRQFVFTIPKILRGYFKRNRKLLGDLAKCAWSALQEFFGAISAEATSAAVICIQTFGNLLNFHPHLHAIVAQGYFKGDTFYPIPETYLAKGQDTLAQIFRGKVLSFLKNKGLLGEDLARNILSWRHNSGFSVHSEVFIEGSDRAGMEKLARYIMRNPVSLERIILGTNGTVCYRTKAVNPNFAGNFRLFKDPLEFTAEILQHIPPGKFQMVRYYGYYSNVARGKRKKEQCQKLESGEEDFLPKLQPEEDPIPLSVRRSWARLISKIYEIDPLICPGCGEKMKIVKFVTKESEVYAVLDELGIPHEARGQPP